MPQFNTEKIRSVAKYIRPFFDKIMDKDEYSKMLKAKDEVLARYRPIFALEHLDSLTVEEYRSFLMFKNNKHWKSLQRMGPSHVSDMPLLRRALKILADDDVPLKERLDILLPPDGGVMVPRFGTATLTPILMVMYPDKYGVFNKPVEDGLTKLDLWPSFSRKISFSEKYLEINYILKTLSLELDIDLWTLDALWWAILLEEDEDYANVTSEPDVYDTQIETHRFGLERYLQEFMRDNWNKIPELSEWELFEQDGDIVGFEYNTKQVGRIDLLARHKTKPKWLVIELKRDQSSDQTVGQVLRYMGWVEENLCEDGEEVFGLIISHSKDDAIKYALKHTNHIGTMLYEVQFNLKK